MWKNKQPKIDGPMSTHQVTARNSAHPFPHITYRLPFQVQSKPEKKPGTPPPAPAPATVSPAPTPRSPSPPPAPVIFTPPPPAVNIPRFYYPRGLPATVPVGNHDGAIAAIEAAFNEFEEEKADIYEMGKIAKVGGCVTIVFSLIKCLCRCLSSVQDSFQG